ncbi:MAG: carbohydrate ABC transporter permease [Treponema sp.]|jgi:ABC-type glycerol-3-phosphate transport system permease component|nr:carbohydrate ABC transporter permease [Treponema sp.]
MNARHIQTRVLLYLFLSAAVAISALPLIWGISSSFKAPAELFSLPVRLFPRAFNLGNYRKILEQGFIKTISNSLLVAGSSVFLVIIMASCCAYALARFRFRGKSAVLWIILLTMMVPGLASLIPTYMIMSRLKMIDTYQGLICAYTALNLPVSVWILRSFFLGLPAAMEEAATIDGAGPWRVFLEIMLPMARPGIAAVAILGFLNAWNDQLVALTIVSRVDLRTVPLVIYLTLGDQGTDWGILTAASVLSVIPTIILFVWLQKNFISGLTAGSIKQ